MRTWAFRAAVGASAALVLAVTVATASAGRLQTSSQQVRAAWSQVEFVIGEGIGTIRCALTLEGSFHARTFTKARETLVGYVTRASIRPCTNGELNLLAESLPWHLRYDSFTGTLPRITSIRFRVVGFSLWFEYMFGIRCLYRSTLTFTWFRGEPSPIPEFPEFETPASVSLEGSMPESGGGFCPGTIRVAGRGGRLTNLGTSTEVTLTLI